MLNTFYIIGAPACGKTTQMEKIMHGWEVVEHFTKPIRYTVYRSGKNLNIYLGRKRDVFSGTDTLSFTALKFMNGLYSAWDSLGKFNCVVAEGDRLANGKFFDVAKKNGDLHLLSLELDELVRNERSEARAKENNLEIQNYEWVKSRITKHQKLAKQYGAYRIDCTGKGRDKIFVEIAENFSKIGL